MTTYKTIFDTGFLVGRLPMSFRRPLTPIVGCCQAAILIALYNYDPTKQFILIFFLVGAMGATDVLIEHTFNVTNALFFPEMKNAAVTLCRWSTGLGSLAAFLFSDWLCAGDKVRRWKRVDEHKLLSIYSPPDSRYVGRVSSGSNMFSSE